MPNRAFSFLVGVVLAGSLIGQTARADLITYWNFNGLVNNTNNGTVYPPDFNTGSLVLMGWTAAGISANGGTVKNALAPDGAGQSLELKRDENNGAMIVISTDLTFFSNPVLSFADRRNGSGFDSIQLSYSTDGVTFTDFGAPFDPGNGTFDIHSFDFSAIDALDGASTAYFKMTLDGATAVGGRYRIDNIQINGVTSAAIPEPSAWMFATAGLVLLTGASLKRKKVPLHAPLN
jgi:hypothetical protein